MNLISNFNIWFDKLREPNRFLLFMGIMCLAIFPLQVGILFRSQLFAFFGLAIMLSMCAIAIVRAFSFGGKHKIVGVAMLAFAITTAMVVFLLIGARE